MTGALSSGDVVATVGRVVAMRVTATTAWTPMITARVTGCWTLSRTMVAFVAKCTAMEVRTPPRS
ncbi:hypothetical protein [Nonomuraea sp. NPDC049309]|uniref:hypothetical protein n=1 Tax=Nonomuraea sp. NPDC049309 TaxID=3364350 RepID=UPI00371ABC7F